MFRKLSLENFKGFASEQTIINIWCKFIRKKFYITKFAINETDLRTK